MKGVITPFTLVGAMNHQHHYYPHWRSDHTLSMVCWDCGHLRLPNIPELKQAIARCEIIRDQYVANLDSRKSNAGKNYWMDNIADKDKQLEWLRSQLSNDTDV